MQLSIMSFSLSRQSGALHVSGPLQWGSLIDTTQASKDMLRWRAVGRDVAALEFTDQPQASPTTTDLYC
jgi:hypothetical protein